MPKIQNEEMAQFSIRVPRKRLGITVCGREFRLRSSASHDLAVVNCKKCLKGIEEVKERKKAEKQPSAKQLDIFIGGRIRRFRKEAQLSQAAFGRKLGMSQVWVSNLELGGIQINLINLINYADALGKKIDDFLPLRRKGKMIF